MRYSTFQDIWKLPDQIRADLGTPLIQGLLDTISKLLAVCGRALLPQAAPVQQVSCLQVQGAGPRQERPGRAAVGAHGSGRRRGPGGDGAAGGEEGRPSDTVPEAAKPGARLPVPRGGTSACARAEGGRAAAAERWPGEDALVAAAPATEAAAGELIPNGGSRFLEDND